MRKDSWLASWPRLILWLHVIGVAGFYSTLWLRTRPGKEDRIKKSIRKPKSSGKESPLVSIIVPARNEEHNIKRCVTSLLEQDYTNYEVIVVDDGSSDGTACALDEVMATHPGGPLLYVLHLRDKLADGWAGKPHALHKGVHEASGEWLLFTDADTCHASHALRSTLEQAINEQIDLFSIGSRQELPGFWNKILMPIAFMGVSMLYPPKLVNDPQSNVAIANGQYILIRRKVYDRLGGYARPELRNTLLDDRDLARVVKENGFKLRFVDGDDLVSVRMYQNFAEIWRGWRKNAYLGNRGGIAFFLLQLIGLPMVCVVPFLLPLFTWITKAWHKGHIKLIETQIATAVEVTAVLAYRSWLNKQLQIPWLYAFFHPLAALLFEGILSQSMWRILMGKGVDWRGRQYYKRL